MESLVKKIGLCVAGLLLPALACAQQREKVAHAKSAFIYAYIVSGAIRSQGDDEPAKVYRAGEASYEIPGARHKVSENASDSEPARLLAVFVVDANETTLTAPDHR
jgi:quercetin dioxygenase-like cupin family protein